MLSYHFVSFKPVSRHRTQYLLDIKVIFIISIKPRIHKNDGTFFTLLITTFHYCRNGGSDKIYKAMYKSNIIKSCINLSKV